MLSIIWYLLLPRTFFPVTIGYLLEHPSAGSSFFASGPANIFSSSLSVPALFFLLPLFLAQLHFLFCLSILHAPSFSIPTSQMLPVLFAQSVVVSRSLHHTILYTKHVTSLFRSSFSKGPQKMLLFLLKASFAIAVLCFTSWQQFMLLLILHPKYLKLSTCSMHSPLTTRLKLTDIITWAVLEGNSYTWTLYLLYFVVSASQYLCSWFTTSAHLNTDLNVHHHHLWRFGPFSGHGLPNSSSPFFPIPCHLPPIPYHGRLARWRKWRACGVGEAKEGLDNELWRRWSNGRVGEWDVT